MKFIIALFVTLDLYIVVNFISGVTFDVILDCYDFYLWSIGELILPNSLTPDFIYQPQREGIENEYKIFRRYCR